MERILRAFGIGDKMLRAVQLSGGHIHGTYRIETENGSYIAQKLHTTAFPEPELLMERLAAVTAHLRQNLHGGVTLRYYQTADVGYLYNGWRLMDCIPGVICSAADGAEVITAAGRAFGMFLTALEGLELPDTPSLHDPVRHFEALQEALDADPCGRAKAARETIRRLLALRGDACAVTQTELPRRLLHGDTKLSNLLFDQNTRKPLAVIDLDTVGWGIAAYDFGDAVRSLHGRAERFDPALLRQFADGYLDSAVLTPAEQASLVPGAVCITAELAARYLADHLTGDRYFANPDSLCRAAQLTALAEDTLRHTNEPELSIYKN